MKKSFKSGLAVLIILLVVIGGAVSFELFMGKKRSEAKSNGINFSHSFSSSKNNTSNNAKTKKYIGAVYIEGTMEDSNNDYNQEWLLSTINSLKNDTNNVAMAIFVNSPGGGVYQADEVYIALQDYKTTGKKIYVYMGPIAASGGYYVSCAANKIYANRNTLTGSIGVISGQIFDISELLEEYGIKTTIIHTGKNKTMGSSTQEFTEEQAEILQSISDECYEQFLSIVVSQRHIPYDKARIIADGRIYTANQALNNGLIDAIDSWENMLSDLEQLVSPDQELKIKTYKKEKRNSLMNSLIGAATKVTNATTAAKLGIPASIIDELNSFNTYPAYLYGAN